MNDIILIGGGGHCKSIIDTIRVVEKYNIIGILDVKEKVGEQIYGIDIIGEDNDLEYYYRRGIKNAFVSLGSIENSELRRKLYLQAYSIGFEFPNIIDSSCIISKSVQLGVGNFIGKGVIINSDVIINNNCIINTGSIIEHDCIIGDFCHIAPGVVMCGNVTVGKNTHIGSNATIIQNIKIDNNNIIGAGSVVIKGIRANQKSVGNPCREVR